MRMRETRAVSSCLSRSGAIEVERRRKIAPKLLITKGVMVSRGSLPKRAALHREIRGQMNASRMSALTERGGIRTPSAKADRSEREEQSHVRKVNHDEVSR